jgi:hypothetical protein
MKGGRGLHASAIQTENFNERAASPIESSTCQTTIRLMSRQLANDEPVEFAHCGNVAGPSGDEVEG